MTKERLDGIKSIIHEKANYYSNIGFDNLAKEFTNVENFLDEIEGVLKENAELKVQNQILKVSPKTEENGAHSSDILLGCINQSQSEVNK